MKCSYCKSTGHNILNCDKAVIDRCYSIFQSNTDPLYEKRSRQIRIFSNLEKWFKDQQGKFPKDLEWDHGTFNRSIIGWRRSIDPEVEVLYLIRNIRGMLPGYPLQDGYPNINYVIRSYSHEGEIKCVKLSFDEQNNLNMEYFEDQDIGIAKHQEYLIELRQLREKRTIYREQQKEKRKFDSLVFCEKVIETEECPICMKELGQTNRAVLRCGHQFCGDCIFHHVQTMSGNRCPCCRQEYTLKLVNRNQYY